MASGSGDTTVRFWDVTTETPLYTCSAHKHWILYIAWSPDGKKLASGCKKGQVWIIILVLFLHNFSIFLHNFSIFLHNFNIFLHNFSIIFT